MAELRIKAKSSSGEPYELVFARTDDRLTIFCPCQAGVYGKLCKHKIGLLQNDNDMLYSDDETAKLNKLQTWIKASELSKLLQDYDQIKMELEALKQKEQKHRRKLEESMKIGIQFIGNEPT